MVFIFANIYGKGNIVNTRRENLIWGNFHYLNTLFYKVTIRCFGYRGMKFIPPSFL